MSNGLQNIIIRRQKSPLAGKDHMLLDELEKAMLVTSKSSIFGE